jgi:hypothetical protein
MNLTEKDRECRKLRYNITLELTESIFPKINKLKEEIRSNKDFKNNEDSDLDYSYQLLTETMQEGRTGGLYNWQKDEKRESFNDFIDRLINIFKNLKNIILFQFNQEPRLVETIDKFYKNYFYLLQWKVFRENFPKQNCLRISNSKGEVENDQLDYRDIDFLQGKKTNQINGAIFKFLRSKGKTFPENYSFITNFATTSFFTLLTHRLWNSSKKHRDNCILPRDFIYDIKDYGNYHIACSLYTIAIYAYMEILFSWREFIQNR